MRASLIIKRGRGRRHGNSDEQKHYFQTRQSSKKALEKREVRINPPRVRHEHEVPRISRKSDGPTTENLKIILLWPLDKNGTTQILVCVQFHAMPKSIATHLREDDDEVQAELRRTRRAVHASFEKYPKDILRAFQQQQRQRQKPSQHLRPGQPV